MADFSINQHEIQKTLTEIIERDSEIPGAKGLRKLVRELRYA